MRVSQYRSSVPNPLVVWLSLLIVSCADISGREWHFHHSLPLGQPSKICLESQIEKAIWFVVYEPA